MAVQSVLYAGNFTASTRRLWSPAVWAGYNWDAQISGINPGKNFFDDFLVASNISSATSGGAVAAGMGQWSTYAYQGGYVGDAAVDGGVINLGSDGDQEGVTLLSSAGSYRIVTTSTLALNPRLVFECRIAKSTITSGKMDAFVGLMTPSLSSNLPAAAQPITTTDGTLSTTPGFLGFFLDGTTSSHGGPTEVGVAFNLASGTVNYPTNLQTLMASTGQTVLAADTYVKLGMVYDPNAPLALVTTATARQTAGTYRRKLIRFFVNGVEAPTFLTTDDVQNATAGQAFPTGFMAPVISTMNLTGSTPGVLRADWLRCSQESA